MRFRSLRRRLTFLVLCCLVVTLYVYNQHASVPSTASPTTTSVPSTPVPSALLDQTFVEKAVYLEGFESTGVLPQNCTLPKVNPWDAHLLSYRDPYYEWKHDVCQPPEEYTRMANGALKCQQGYKCKGRCINRKTGWSSEYGAWKHQGDNFDCDLIHTKVSIDGGAEKDSLVTQIVEKEEIPEAENHSYNVYVIVVDSTGYSQAYRNLPRTLHFLKRQLDVVEFPYLNKVGHNSFPNAVPLWLGDFVERIDKSIYGLNATESTFDCENAFDKRETIVQNFMDAGYATFQTEIWMSNTMYSCVGSRREAHHSTQPLTSIFYNTKLMKFLDDCQYQKKAFFLGLDHFSQFMRAYQSKKKFGWIWLTKGLHDGEEESVTKDVDIFATLVDNQEELDRSFVFFFGDHGLRYGKLDNNNPYLAVSLPANLRGGPLHRQLQKNAKQMQTHYDTRATWLDLLKWQPAADWRNTSDMEIEGERGQSLFRRQMGARDCYSLPIPFQYCICDFKIEAVNKSSYIAKRLEEATLNHIHGRLTAENHNTICGFWESTDIEVEAYSPMRKVGIFKVTLSAEQEKYSDAKFKATLKVSPDGRIRMINIKREDSYGKAGDCAREDLQDLCHCLVKMK